MTAAPKPPTGLPGSVAIHLPAFKRKRIEQWCEDVAQYLRAGSLCRSVIGHVMDDNRIPSGAASSGPNGPKSAPAAPNHRTAAIAAASASSLGTMTEMLSLGNNGKKAEGGGGGGGVGAAAGGTNTGSANHHHHRDHHHNHHHHGHLNGVVVGNSSNNVNGNNGNVTTTACIKVTKLDPSAPLPGRGTPMPDTSGPLPVVKFSYSQHNEQRRRIDRLVQGLPVLSASTTPNAGSALERLSGANGAVVYVNGEEPVRTPGGYGSAGSKERQSRSPGRSSPAPGPVNPAHSRSSSGEPRQRSSRPSQQVPRHQSISPSPTRPHHHPIHPNTLTPHTQNLAAAAPKSSEIVVIEDEFHAGGGHNNLHGNEYTSTGFRALNFDGGGSRALKRTQSEKVHKARQRMLASTRRSREQSNHVPAHVPVQSCWALAELTW